MDWLELSAATDGETSDAVVELFNRFGRERAVIEVPVDCFEFELEQAPPPDRVIVKTYLPADGSGERALRRLEEGLWHLQQISPAIQFSVHRLTEADWAEAWKKQYHRLPIGRRLVIVPAWEDYTPDAGQVAIRLEPGMAFGTGLHPTTRLCLQAVENCLVPGGSVLDVGTGSGVLAIAAAKMGATSVLALDADAVAVGVARENVELNGVADRVVVRHGTLPGGSFRRETEAYIMEGGPELVDSGKYDLVVINILAPVIAGMASALAARMRVDGQLIASGLILSQADDVEASLRAQGLVVVDRSYEQDWVALVARRG